MTARRLAFLVVRYFEHGGMQRTMRRIAETCRDRGHAVSVFTTSFDGDAWDGVDVHVLPARARTNHGRNRDFSRQAAARARELGADLVVGFDKLEGLDVYYAADPCLAARLAARRGTTLLSMLPRYRGLLALERAVFAARRDVRILLHAHAQEAAFIRHWRTDPSRFVRLPPGIDRGRLERESAEGPDRAAVRAELGIASDRPFILLVGSSYRTKGVDRLIALLAARPRLVAAVAGRDDLRRWRAAAERSGVADRLRLLGARDAVAPLYRAADLLVHPARVENTGTTLLEAMICGLPVVCSGVCGFAHHVLVADAGVVLDEPFVAADLERAVDLLLADRARLRDRSAAARSYADRVDLVSLIERAVDAIEAAADAVQRMEMPA